LRNGVFASRRDHGNGKNSTQNNTVNKAGAFHLGASLSSWLQQTSCVSVVNRASRELTVFAEIVGAASESSVTSEAQSFRGHARNSERFRERAVRPTTSRARSSNDLKRMQPAERQRLSGDAAAWHTR
jgi:hypothetical protein